MVDEVLDHHLRTVQTTGRYIFSQHGVADVHSNDGLNTGTLLVGYFRAKLRTRYHHNEQGKGGQQEAELDERTEARHVGHQFAHQRRVAETAQAFFLLMNHPEANDNQQGYHSQQIEIYGVFESKHFRAIF